MEIITPEQYPEYEAFVLAHPQGGFTQSTRWQQVKNNWGWEGVLSRGGDGKIRGACGVLIQKIPALHTSFPSRPQGGDRRAGAPL